MIYPAGMFLPDGAIIIFFFAIVFCLSKSVCTKLGIPPMVGRAQMRHVVDFLEKKAAAHSEIDAFDGQNSKINIFFLNFSHIEHLSGDLLASPD